MNVTIRDLEPADVEPLAALLAQARLQPVSPDALQKPAFGQIWRPRVAVLQDGAVVGSSILQQSESDKSSHGWMHIDVAPEFQRQGVGKKLYQDTQTHARSIGLTYLHGNVLENRPGGIDFARYVGFYTKRQTYHSELSLATFEESPFMPQLAHHQAQGIRFASFIELGDGLEQKKKLYELNKTCSTDIPGRGPFFSFDAFCAWRFDRPVYRKAGVIVALADEKWVGFSIGTYHESGNFVFNQMTGVIREYRGTGLSIPLKLMVTRFAKTTPSEKIMTFNDTENRPMLRINEKLGYKRSNTAHWVEKRMC